MFKKQLLNSLIFSSLLLAGEKAYCIEQLDIETIKTQNFSITQSNEEKLSNDINLSKIKKMQKAVDYLIGNNKKLRIKIDELQKRKDKLSIKNFSKKTEQNVEELVLKILMKDFRKKEKENIKLSKYIAKLERQIQELTKENSSTEENNLLTIGEE